MTIIFVGNTLGDVGGLAEEGNTSPHSSYQTPHDPDYNPKWLRTHSLSNAEVPFSTLFFGAVPSGDVWMHFRFNPPRYFNAEADGHIVSFRDETGTLVARLDVLNGGVQARVFGDAEGFNSGTLTTLTDYALYTFDMRVSVGADIVMDLYNGGVLISTATIANTEGKGRPAYAIFDNDDLTQVSSLTSSDRKVYFSEIIATDGESTIGWRLATLEPLAQGHYNEITGDVSNLIFADDGLSISSATPGHRKSWTLSSYNGPAAPAGGIRAVIAKTHSALGVTGPENVRPFVRIGGVDYLASADIRPAALVGENYVMDVNPATGLAWTPADLASLEQGIEVKA